MSFPSFVESILSTGPSNIDHYKTLNQLFRLVVTKELSQSLKQLQQLDKLKVIKSSTVIVTPQAENSISVVNYRRIPAYIEFYNEESKHCVRIILSTRNDSRLIVGFYSNYTKNGRNNHFSKETKMINEIYIPNHFVERDGFYDKMANFLLGAMSSPYAEHNPTLH